MITPMMLGIAPTRRRRIIFSMGQPVLGSTASNRVTWAATTRQPSAVRSQVCIWRPNLPDETRRYSQLAVAKSVP